MMPRRRDRASKLTCARSRCPQLSIGVLSTMFVGVWAATGGKKQMAGAAPAINASSRDEENFIQYVASASTPSPTIPLCLWTISGLSLPYESRIAMADGSGRE